MADLLISADDHIDLGYLPADLWLERLPQEFRDRGPRVEERDGREVWVCDGAVDGGLRPPSGPRSPSTGWRSQGTLACAPPPPPCDSRTWTAMGSRSRSCIRRSLACAWSTQRWARASFGSTTIGPPSSRGRPLSGSGWWRNCCRMTPRRLPGRDAARGRHGHTPGEFPGGHRDHGD